MRRRLAGMGVLGILIFLGTRFFSASQTLVKVDVHYLLPGGVQDLAASFVVEGELEEIAHFETRLVGHLVLQKAHLKPGWVRVTARMTMVDGPVVSATRQFEAREGAEVQLDLRDGR